MRQRIPRPPLCRHRFDRNLLALFLIAAAGMHPRAEVAVVTDGPGPEAAAAAGTTAAQALEQCLREVVAPAMPDLEPVAVVRFYEEYSPDLVADFSSRKYEDQAAAARYAGRLATHFTELESVRRRSPKEYERLLELEELETTSRRLGLRVRKLEELLAADGDENAAAGALRADAMGVRTGLRRVLERIFAARQQNQLIEINRLEAEVQDLRRLAQEREAQREHILEYRFRELVRGTTGAADEPVAIRPGADGSTP